jgi:hypothetical protein
MLQLFKFALISATSFIVFSTPALGQTGKVSFRTTRFETEDTPAPEFSVGTTDSKQKIKVPLTYIAGPYKAILREGMYLDFWRGTEETPEITVTIEPSELENLLLVFLPKGDSYQVSKILTDSSRIKAGDTYIINSTTSDLAFKVGEAKPVLVIAKKTAIIKGPMDKGTLSRSVLLSKLIDKKWIPIASESWPCDPKFITFLFVYISPRTQKHTYHSVAQLME